jgi:hypothetical protein
MVVVFNCPAQLPSSCRAAFRSARSHCFAQPVSGPPALTREAGRTSAASRGFFLHSAVARWDRLHRNRDNSRPLRIGRASCTSSE